MEDEESTRTVREPTLLAALIPMAALILLIAGSLLILGVDACPAHPDPGLLRDPGALPELVLPASLSLITAAMFAASMAPLAQPADIALVLPARIYRVEFAKRGVARHQPLPAGRRQRDRHLTAGSVELLRRIHGCGARRADRAVLYLPYAVFCIASPLLSVIYGITGFKIRRIEPIMEDST
jgi:Na+/H+ antiporter NhaC